MRISWIWALPLLAIQGLTACATSESGAGAGAAATAADPATLTAYHWQLREVRNPQGQLQTGWSLPPAPAASANAPDRARAVQLTFNQGRVAVARLCNVLSAGYQLDGQALAIGPVMGTMMACPDSAAMALEQQVGQRLPQASRWAIAAPQAGRAATPVLTLSFQDGGQWLLDGEPTDATRYGSAGERIFLEVAPQRVACSHPLIPQYQCLQVRAIEYDGQGLKSRVGPWENFYSEIQGYTHQPGVRNVLRIQRFQRPVTPADASSYAYVLDMTVESEIVR